MKNRTLSPTELSDLQDYLEEIDALIECDDGDLIPGALLEKHEHIKEILDGSENTTD